MFKDRFKGFNDDFARLYDIHHPLSVIDNGLRKELQQAVKDVFLSRYQKFYEQNSRYRFSKKNQSEYLKYPPPKVDSYVESYVRRQLDGYRRRILGASVTSPIALVCC
jgi:hypothetical protein